MSGSGFLGIVPVLLGGSCVAISREILITHIRKLIALLVTAHEPPSRVQGSSLYSCITF